MKTKSMFMLFPVLISALAWGLVLGVAQTTGAAQPAPLTAETTVELVGHLGSRSQGAVVVGNYGFNILGGELAVLDLSDPANPTRVGYTMLPLPGDDLDIEGNYAYVIGNLGALSQMVVVDVSVPTQPAVVGTLAVAGGGIDVSGSYAYLVGDSFQVVDISDPAHPALAGSCATSGRDVYLVGDYAYVAGGDLKVVNVADPDAPVQVGAAPASAYGVFVANGYAYVADFTSSSCDLRVFDVSNPATPQEVGSEELFTGAWSEAHDLYVAGSYAYVAGSAYIGGGVSYGGVDVVDISEPASPHSVGDYVAPDIWRTTAVAMTGNRAYLAAGSDGLRVLDVTDPANPTEAGVLLTAWGDDVVVSNPDPSGREPAYAYLGNWGLGVVDISDPAYPIAVGRYLAPPPNYGENRVDRAGSYVYVSDVVGTLYVLDASDPAQPVVAGSYEDLLSVFRDLDVDETGSYAYLAAGDPDDLLVLDVSDPAHITQAGTYDLPAEPTSLYISGTQAYVGDEEGLWVLDISDPTQPAEQGHVDISHGVQAVQGQGEYAYALNIDNSGWEAELSLLAIDVADPAQPIVAGSSPIASGAWAEGLYVSGDRAYVAGDDLWVLDIGDPASPALIATYKPWGDDASASLLGGFSGVYVAGEYIYALGTDTGLHILKLSTLALEVSPASITWLAEAGGSDPSPRRLSIQSNGRPLTWTAQISPTVEWLEITPPAGDTPATLTATAHISGLVVGQYTTSLVITSPLVSDTQQIPVTLRVAEEIFDVYLPLVLR